MNACRCGCGNQIPEISKRGKPQRYLKGHNWRENTGFVQRSKGVFGENHPNWKGGRYESEEGYVFVSEPNHPRSDKRGYVLEQILVIERLLGRALAEDEYISHKNGIASDNQPENLTLRKKWGSCRHSGGYVLVSMKGHPRADKDGHILEHIVVMEKQLGRYLRSDEIVHHINGLRTDNRPENLELTNRSDHARYHTNIRHETERVFGSKAREINPPT